MSATNIASLAVMVGADIEPLKDGLKSAQSSVSSWASSVGKKLKGAFSDKDAWTQGLRAGRIELVKGLDDIINAAAIAMGKSTGIAALIALPLQLMLGVIEATSTFYDIIKKIFTSIPLGIGKAFGVVFMLFEELLKLPFRIAGGLAALFKEATTLFVQAIIMPGVFWSKVLVGVYKTISAIASVTYRIISSIPTILKGILSGVIAGIKMIPKILSVIIGLVFDVGKALIKGVFSTIRGIFSLLSSDAVKNALLGIGVGAIAIGTAMAYAAKKGMDFIVTTTTMADKLGISVEAMTQLDYAAKLANVSIDDVATGIKMMLKNVSLAVSGSGPAKNILGELGLDPKAIASMRPEEMLLVFADALASVGNAADRTRIAMALFGRGGDALIPLLSQGSQGLVAMAQDANAVVGSFNRVDAEQVMRANNAIQRMQESFRKTGLTLAVAVAPFVEYVSSLIADFGTNGSIANGLLQQGFEVTTKILAFMVDTIQLFVEKIKTIPAMVGAMAEHFTSLGKTIWAAIGWLLPKGQAAVGYLGGKTKDFFASIFPETSILESEKWSNKAAAFFKEIQDGSRAAAQTTVNDMNQMTEGISQYALYLEEAKERAKALAEAAKQNFRQGPLQTMAINTPVNRALFNQQLNASRFDKEERQNRLLEQIAYNGTETNRQLRDGVPLRAS